MGSTAALIRSGILIWEVLWCWSLWRLWRGTSWQGHGRDVVVWWQWCSRKPPSNRHKWRFSVQKNVMPSCWWLASWWWVYQIYIYIQIIYIPFVTKLLEMALEFANQREGKHPGSRSQMSRVFSNPKGSAKKTHETAVSGFHPCWWFHRRREEFYERLFGDSQISFEISLRRSEEVRKHVFFFLR